MFAFQLTLTPMCYAYSYIKRQKGHLEQTGSFCIFNITGLILLKGISLQWKGQLCHNSENHWYAINTKRVRLFFSINTTDVETWLQSKATIENFYLGFMIRYGVSVSSYKNRNIKHVKRRSGAPAYLCIKISQIKQNEKD